MSMCRVFSCVVGRGCLLWPVHSVGKTLLAFALLHSVLQGWICLLLQVFLDFLLLIPKCILYQWWQVWLLSLDDSQAHFINYWACSKEMWEFSTSLGLKESDARKAPALKENILLSLQPHVYSGVWEMVWSSHTNKKSARTSLLEGEYPEGTDQGVFRAGTLRLPRKRLPTFFRVPRSSKEATF